MRMNIALSNRLRFLRKELETYELRIRNLSPAQQLIEKRTLAADLANQLENSMKNNLREKRFLLQMYIEKLNGLSPLKKLNQGYSFVADAKGKAVTSIEDIRKQDELTIHVTDGAIKALVKETEGIIRV